MGNFFNRDSAEILKPYHEKYIEAVRAFAACGNRDLMQDFIGHTCPGFNITDSFIESLKKIEAEFKDDPKYDSYCRSIGEVHGSLEICQKIKAHASS